MTGINSENPFLIKFASSRMPHPPLPGHYSPAMDVWVEGDEVETPIVQAHGGLVELRTKTFADQETDEDDVGRQSTLLELETKTSMVPESDDELHRSPLLELETKTEQQIEQDDESRPIL